MKNDQYFKHDVSASANEKLMELIQKEGLRGYGAYWMLIEGLRTQPQMKAPLKLLTAFAYRLHTKVSYLHRIIEDYGLFSIEGDYFFSPGLCKRMKRFTKSQEAFDKRQEELNERRKSQNENQESQNENLKAIQDSHNSLINRLTLVANVCIEEKSIEEKNNNSNSTDAKMPDGRNQPTLLQSMNEPRSVTQAPQSPVAPQPVTLLARTDTPRATPRLQPVGHWNRLIDEMTTDEPWMQMVGMHSGLKRLYIAHRPEIVELFRQHIRLYDKGGTLLRVQDVKQYFVNFLSPGGVTHTKVREHLLQMLRRQNLDAGSNPFETVINGKRTYLGYPIPDDAPPRPDAQSVWDDETKSWRR